MAIVLDVPPREQTAERLLAGSARRSLDPAVEVDWKTPLDPTVFAMPEHRISLYGTEMYDWLTYEQKVTLSRHEVASMASVGIWFEMILMQMLLRHSYDLDPRSNHVRYALTEIADECRHSQMFADMIEYLGVPNYGPGRIAHELGRLCKTGAHGTEIFAATLVAEEILDTLQREGMKDDTILPVVSQVSRVHVVEEARHVRYARDELARQIADIPRPALEAQKVTTAISAYVISSRLIHPGCYAAVGLDPKAARKAAAHNPVRRETLRWTAARLTEYLDSVGFLSGPARSIWRKAGLVA